MSSQHVVDYVRQSVKNRKALDQICEDLMEHCLAPDSDCSGVGCDNMTVLIVAILRGRTLEEWYDNMAQKLENGVGYATPSIDALPTPFRNANSPQGVGAGGGGAGNSLGQVLSGTSLLYNRPGGGHGGDEDSDEEDNLLSRLQSALEQQGIHIVEQGSEDAEAEEVRMETADDEDAEMGSVDSAPSTDGQQTMKTSGETNGEVSHPAVAMDGLSDKVRLPSSRQLLFTSDLCLFMVHSTTPERGSSTDDHMIGSSEAIPRLSIWCTHLPLTPLLLPLRHFSFLLPFIICAL